MTGIPASTTGAITLKTAPNFESPTDIGANNVYDINATASDGTLTTTQALAIAGITSTMSMATSPPPNSPSPTALSTSPPMKLAVIPSKVEKVMTHSQEMVVTTT